MENKEIKDWKTRLRELYLDENDATSFIKEITFDWGTFLFTPNLKHRPINYYIATQESIEDFLSQELEKAKEEGRKEILEELYAWATKVKQGEWIDVPEGFNGRLTAKLQLELSKLNK